ncbi:hypothetical protein B7494_g4288 [Chlorociboria aeruginascens]|nr:hypothetical protein B7494_g4288 [Chlorociboria aeruginascens]
MLISVSITALLVAIVAGSPVQTSSYAVKETHLIPRGWEKIGEAPGEHIVALQIGLKQGNFEELERSLYEVSDPTHPRYGQHLNETEVNFLIQPTSETLGSVHSWLFSYGIETSSLSYSPAKDWIKISLPVSTIETLLDTKYSIYKHSGGDTLVRTPKWSLPSNLHPHISTIQPTTSFFRPRAQKTTLKSIPLDDFEALAPPASMPFIPAVETVCNTSAITPLCLRTLYGTIDYVAQVPGTNKMALNDFLGESNNRSDTSLFLQKFRPEAAPAAYTFDVQLINGGVDEQTQLNATELANGQDLEGNLDSETLLGIAYPTPMTAFITGGSPPYRADLRTPTNSNEPYLDWLNYVLALEDIPQVVSTSYQDDEQTVPLSYATAVCNGFAQLSARGVSVIFGSGDNGVGEDGTCVTNDGQNTTTFLAMFPSTCPFVTSVGATKFIPEVVATDTGNGFVSGGGFSRYFPRPAYQGPVVSTYIASLGSQFSGLYNPDGRGFPDLAAQGYHYSTVWNGTEVILDGTSASTPTISAIVALLNDALLAAGKPVMGFLNPWLYIKGFEAFTDVTVGSALGCGTDGFPAQEGWDAVTGFGTPYFPKIKDLLLRDISRGVERDIQDFGNSKLKDDDSM